MRQGRLSALVLLLAAGCGGPRVTEVATGWVVTPELVELGEVYVGGVGRGSLTVRSHSRAAVELTLELPAPFAGQAAVSLPGGAVAEVVLEFRPDAPGPVEGAVVFTDGLRRVEVPLTGTGLAVPSCATGSPCRKARFDVVAGRCVELTRPDGLPCQSACLVDAVCSGGQCVGTARGCDDGNACTLDSCDSAIGCTHQDISQACPASPSLCHVSVCRPETGCGLMEVTDGTRCGLNDCTTAQVCIGGQCVARSAPEGSSCGEPGVCQAEGTCRGNACEPGPATYPKERWRYAKPDRFLSFQGTVGPDGTTYFSDASSTDASAPLELVAITQDGRERFRAPVEPACRRCGATLMLDVEGQRVLVGFRGKVQARRMSDGALLWVTDTAVGKALRSPSPDGGARLSSSAFIRLAPDLVIQQLVEGYELHREYSVALDPATGAVRWERDWWGHVYNPGATSAGQLWVAGADCWAALQQSQVIGSAGEHVGTVTLSARPLAFEGERALLTSSSGLLWASSNGAATPLPASVPGVAWAMATRNRAVVASSARATLLQGDGGLVRWGPSPGSLRGGALLTDDRTLLSVQVGDGGSTLVALDAHGDATFSCPVPGNVGVGAPHQGLWVTQLSAHGRSALVAFEIPGVELEARGWVLPNGSPLNERRPR